MKTIQSLIFLIFSFSAFSQSITLSVLKKADDAFDEFSYSKAVTYYKLALKSENEGSYVTSQIGLSYRNLNEQDSAEVWLKKAIDKGEKNPDFKYFLAEALLSNQKREEAKYWYQAYNDSVEGDSRSDRKLTALDNFDQFFIKEDLITVTPLKDNSPGLDFSPAFFKEGLLFVSSRPKSKWVNTEFNWDESSFLDLYYLANADSSAEYYAGGLNTKYHEGPLIIYNSGKSIAYTRNNYDGRKLVKDEKGITNLKLFFAQWDDKSESWINEVPFEYNNDEYSVSSPAISEDGKILVFSSNMAGGNGASDLYLCRKTENGWSKPENLGKSVNSKGRDGFPFIHGETLYFSSDGREGLGGLDIYQITFTGANVLGEAKNLGAPINGSKDDFGLIKDGNVGYFASNRIKINSDDIYKFLIAEPEMIAISGDVYDADSKLPLERADVFFKSDNDQLLYTRSLDSGVYEAPVQVNSNWIVTAGKFGYELVSPLNISLNRTDSAANRIFLRKIVTKQDSIGQLPDVTTVADNRIPPYEETASFVDSFRVGDTVRFDIVYYDLDKSLLRPESKVTLNKVANFMIEHVDVKAILASHTDSRSSKEYNKALSQRRSNSSEDYLIFMGANPAKIQKMNYGEEKPSNDCLDNKECDEEAHQSNRRTEVILIKTEVDNRE